MNHSLFGFHRDDLDFYTAECECGWESPPCPGKEDATDSLLDHVRAESASRALAHRRGYRWPGEDGNGDPNQPTAKPESWIHDVGAVLDDLERLGFRIERAAIESVLSDARFESH